MATIPEHLPARLTICLWDFSWYTQSMPGEPFEDLDRAFEQAVARGFNTVRICALPLVLFGDDAAPEPLRLANFGGGYGQGTRWYNCRGGATIDGRARLLELLRAARRHGCYVIVSSWEYQQSLSFFQSRDTFDRLLAIPPAQRYDALARAHSRLVAFAKEHDLADRIAYVELHNEVENQPTRLSEVAGPGEVIVAAERPHLERAVAAMRADHPDMLFTVGYSHPKPHQLWDLAANLQVAHFHVYVYGPLRQLFRDLALLDQARPFPTALGRAMLRDGAPPPGEWQPDEPWRLAATSVSDRFFYTHDWVDPRAWDRYLYEIYGAYRETIRREIMVQLESFAAFAARYDIPAVIGEGYLGYTPLRGTFEEGPVGTDVAEFAMTQARALGYWGVVPASNAAPHHPLWGDVEWLRRVNRAALAR